MFTVQNLHAGILRIASAFAIIITTASGVHAATVSWDPNTEPDIAGYKVSFGTQAGVHTTTIDVGKVTTFEFNPPPGQRSYVVVQAYSTSGKLSPMSAEATIDVPVPVPNQPPTLALPPNQSSARNTQVALWLVATDPDSKTLSFTANGLPPGLAIDNVSGVIAGVVSKTGSYEVTVAVSDGALWVSRSFMWTVTDNTGAIVVDLSPLDTTLRLDTVNYSTSPTLWTFTWPNNRVGGAILMKFDLSQIPANATIQSALLHLSLVRVDDKASDPYYRISLHRIINRNPDIALASGTTANGVALWTASSCCYQGYPMAQKDLGPVDSSAVIDRALGVKTWDAGATVGAWRASPSSNYGLLLSADTTKGAESFRIFASVQEPIAAQRPFLRVSYTLPTGNSATPGVSTPVPSGSVNIAVPPAPVVPTPLLLEATDLGVTGDFDGDGREDLGAFRAGGWRTWRSRSNFSAPVFGDWGMEGDLPVPADYDGDRVTDLAIYRPSEGTWYVRASGNKSSLSMLWGNAADRPVAIDHDGDGKADLALIRDGGYKILLSSTNYSTSVVVR